MPIKEFHDSLPHGNPDPIDGSANAPSPVLHLLGPALDIWHNELDHQAPDVAVAGRRFRASRAGLRCDRQLAYALTDTPETNPPSVADTWRMQAGTDGHKFIGEIIAKLGKKHGIKKIHAEAKVDLEGFGLDGAANADFIIEWKDGSPTGADFTAVELKTQNGFGFKQMTTPFNGPPEGPRDAHRIQGCLAAAGWAAAQENKVDCDVCIAYLSLENVGAALAKKWGISELGRFAAEWWVPANDALVIAIDEASRVENVFDIIDSGRLPERILHDPSFNAPGIMQIANPATGLIHVVENTKVVWSDKTWMCGYCRHQEQCIADLEATKRES